jgi:hypothetical protein
MTLMTPCGSERSIASRCALTGRITGAVRGAEPIALDGDLVEVERNAGLVVSSGKKWPNMVRRDRGEPCF